MYKPGFSVEDFRNGIARTGLSKANKYVLKISPPTKLVGKLESRSLEEIFLRIDTVELPGKSLATSEVKYYGPPRKSPYGMTYEDLNCTIMLSANIRERYIFSQWMNAIYDYDTARLEYFQNYTTNLEFITYSEDGNALATTTFEEAFPLSIGAVNFSYANEDIAKMPLTFAYRKWFESAPVKLSGALSPYSDLANAHSYISSKEYGDNFEKFINQASTGSPLGQLASGFSKLGGIDASLNSVVNNMNSYLSEPFQSIQDIGNKITGVLNEPFKDFGNLQNRISQFNPVSRIQSQATNFVKKRFGGLFG